MNNEEMVYLPFFFYQFTFNERAFIKQMLIHTGFGKKYVPVKGCSAMVTPEPN